jgi:hypothetical protein
VVKSEASDPAHCELCAARASTFDLSKRCCLDRYESLFGSVHEHRKLFVHAMLCGLDGNFMPARRLVESYRRVFGPMAAVELRRSLWHAIGDAQARPHQRPSPDARDQRPAA